MKNQWRKLAWEIVLCILVTACERNVGGDQNNTTTADVVSSEQSFESKRPNFLIIVADDMGYSDLGSFGSEIATPNLDVLAEQGIRLTDFHTAAACSPTRAMMLTGKEAHAVGVGTVGYVLPAQRGKPGYMMHLDEVETTLADVLGDNGYHTMMVGKWHLGKADNLVPYARGFETTFALLDGGHNHFDGPNLGPPTQYRANGKPVQWPKGRFSSDYFTEKMVSFLNASRSEDRPFFAYLSFTAPHWPLQANAKDIEKYQGFYEAGPEELRESRLAGQKALGLNLDKTVSSDLETQVTRWRKLSDDKKRYNARKMEIHAAMVDNMDRNIGLVLAELRESGKLENTVIVFFSDNGAEGNFGGEDGVWGFTPLVQIMKAAGLPAPVIDNSYSSLGSENSIVSIGKGWAYALSAPFSGHKTLPSEGGIRTAALISGVGIPQGLTSDEMLHVADLFPTILDLANISQPVVNSDDQNAIAVQSGRSWRSFLRNTNSAVYGENDDIGWEFLGGSALRRGDWKAVYVQGGSYGGGWSPGTWKLYDLAVDPGETSDLAQQYPERLRELAQAWHSFAKANDVVMIFPETQSVDAL